MNSEGAEWRLLFPVQPPSAFIMFDICTLEAEVKVNSLSKINCNSRLSVSTHQPRDTGFTQTSECTQYAGGWVLNLTAKSKDRFFPKLLGDDVIE